MVAEICRYKLSVAALADMLSKYLQRSVSEFRTLICENAPNCTTKTYHRAACVQSGDLEAGGGPLERTAARICRQGPARVTRTTRLSDLNIQSLSRIDDRRIEALANGLPMWGGTQLALDNIGYHFGITTHAVKGEEGFMQDRLCRMLEE